MKIPNVKRLVETEKEKLRSSELEDSGVALSRRSPCPPCSPRRGCLRSPVGVSLCCAGCEAGLVLGVPSGVWGSRTRRGAVLGGKWGVRSRENVNFIPSCRCGTSVQQGRGPCLPARAAAAASPPPLCGRPARPPGWRPLLPSAPRGQVAANSFAS